MVLGRLINKVGWGGGPYNQTKKKCGSADQNTFLRREKSISFQYKLVGGEGGGGAAGLIFGGLITGCTFLFTGR